MSAKIIVHPCGNKWKRIMANVYGEYNGDCVVIFLNDGLTSIELNLHYGSSRNKNDFILKLREAINGLQTEE